MRKFHRMLIGLGVTVAALMVIAFLLPRHVTVARSIFIEATPTEVFFEVNSLQRFNVWSPWSAIDPQMQYAYSGPGEGVGNAMSWIADHPDLESGSQRIVRSEPGQVVESVLDFGSLGLAKTRFRLESQGPRTIVTWSFEIDMGFNPVMRFIGLFMDGWIGKPYENGLESLKVIVENKS